MIWKRKIIFKAEKNYWQLAVHRGKTAFFRVWRHSFPLRRKKRIILQLHITTGLRKGLRSHLPTCGGQTSRTLLVMWNWAFPESEEFGCFLKHQETPALPYRGARWCTWDIERVCSVMQRGESEVSTKPCGATLKLADANLRKPFWSCEMAAGIEKISKNKKYQIYPINIDTWQFTNFLIYLC